MSTLQSFAAGLGNTLVAIIKWIFSHKKIVFIYIPLTVIIITSLYVTVIYFSWLSDKEHALEILSRYKRLIDRTEEMRSGYVYSYNDVDLSSKVVDIPTRIYDRNNEIIGEFFEQKREIVPFNHIPNYLVNAVVASEDREFRNHNGVSFKGIFRAFIINILNFRVVQGGSTITQQLAKVLFTDMERSLKRKIYEMFCALEIEQLYDKDDILSMYLNLIYFGNGAYGVESAAKMFFGKSVQELTKSECALIVATISNPGIYSPIQNLDNSIKKTRRILKSMVDAGYMKKGKADREYDRFLKKWQVTFDEKGDAFSSNIGSFLYSNYRINRAPFFNERIRRVLVEKFGEEVVKKGGLKIYTTIDGAKQDVALRSLQQGIRLQRDYHLTRAKRIRNKRRSEAEKEKADNIEGAVIAIDPITGEILAYAGGYEFGISNQFDSVSQIKRQPGSSFKPFIYVAAVQNKDITPATVMVDKKTVFPGGYSPRNYDNNYTGNIIIQEALRRSINVIAVKVLQKSGFDTVYDIIQNGLALSSSEMRRRFGRTLSLALGTYEVSPLENCALHSLLINGGNYIFPYGLRHVKDYNGNVVWDYEAEVLKITEERRKDYGVIVDPAAAAVVVSMLQGVFKKGGTAYYAVRNRSILFHIAGKTGTSTNYNDAWFVGYTSNLVTAVWVGNKKGAISLGPGRAGGVVAAPVWADFISNIYGSNSPGKFQFPENGLTTETVCTKSGLVAQRTGECEEFTFEQLFLSGTEPGEYCNIHIPQSEDENEENKIDENKVQVNDE